MNISRCQWIFDKIGTSNILKDKQQLINQYIQYMFIRTQQMFRYENLPDTIPSKDLELILQVNGNATVTKVNDKLYAFSGALGGILNEYYLPTISTVSNPYLKFTKNLEINKDCCVILNDALYIGLTPLFNKYASLLAETDISLRYGCINSRILSLLVADNDASKESCLKYLTDIEQGNDLGVIASNTFFEGIKTQDYGNKTTTNIKDLIELQQYLKANWYMELGLNANWNGKREAINESEASLNEDALIPLIDEMLLQRQLGCERVNMMYGTNISVKLNSSWENIRNEIVDVEKMPNNEVNINDNNE